jgi:formiminotetrahydrofolate cyclodeaminase
MKAYRTKFKSYVDDLAKKVHAPGGGSALCLVFCLGVSLIEMAMRFSQKASDKKLATTLKKLKALRNKVYPGIDLDSKLFDQIMRSQGKKRDFALKKSEDLVVMVGRSCESVFLLAKSAKSGIKKGIISDFIIGLDLVRVVLKGCIFNLEANATLFGRRSKYITIFKRSLRKWQSK